jgi:predicted Fe-S protein YdhL (DUF1289 family)
MGTICLGCTTTIFASEIFAWSSMKPLDQRLARI